ncbi:hypothetical protein ScPMuIL_002993 [Solemya velum]
MATSRKPGHNPSSNLRSSEVLLKQRVKELEEEVTSLKRRLDDLRKAKNQTFLKREREVLEVGTPFSKRTSHTEPKDSVSQKNGGLQKLNESGTRKELSEMKQKYENELEEMKQKMAMQPACDHEPVIASLRSRVKELEDDNAAILLESSDLKDRVGSLMHELGLKEASWCEREEQLKIQIQRSWGEKYREWMEKTEAKLAELQQTNMLLRGYLKNKKPQGPDPTGQDKTDPDKT